MNVHEAIETLTTVMKSLQDDRDRLEAAVKLLRDESNQHAAKFRKNTTIVRLLAATVIVLGLTVLLGHALR